MGSNDEPISAIKLLHDRYIGDDPERIESFERMFSTVKIAMEIQGLRKRHNLTQRELAERMGTTPSVISRMESEDYTGHSVESLRMIALAVGERVEICFVPREIVT